MARFVFLNINGSIPRYPSVNPTSNTSSYLREVANIWVNNKNFTPSRSFEVFSVVAKNQIRQVSNQINGIKENFEKFCEFGEKMVHTISTGITLHLDICSFNY